MIERTLEAGKTYSFNNQSSCLPAQHWFQDTINGYTLFLVFYTMACRWASCLGCNLPSKSSQTLVNFESLMRQIDYVFFDLLNNEQKVNLRQIIISNNGSILDQDTFSSTALIYLIAKMNIECPNISVLTLETRPEYVDDAELEFIHRSLQEGKTPTNLEIAIGFEIFDNYLRNNCFDKGLEIDVFEKMAIRLARYKYQLVTYFMFKPLPQMTEKAAIKDIHNAINYLDMIVEKHKIQLTLYLNPTYVATGTQLETAFLKKEYYPPNLESVVEAIKPAKDTAIKVYVGLSDEGLAVPNGSFRRQGDDEIFSKLAKFNATQDYSLLT